MQRIVFGDGGNLRGNFFAAAGERELVAGRKAGKLRKALRDYHAIVGKLKWVAGHAVIKLHHIRKLRSILRHNKRSVSDSLIGKALHVKFDVFGGVFVLLKSLVDGFKSVFTRVRIEHYNQVVVKNLTVLFIQNYRD